MNTRNRTMWAYGGIGALIVACWAVPSASAAIIGTDATVSVTVQERIDGTPGSVSSDTDELGTGSSNLPLVAFGDLSSTDLDGVLVSMAQAFSEFSDPTRMDQPNPEEFALEVGCYANAESVSYSVTSLAAESRTVVFTKPGNPLAEPEIDFGFGSRRTVESRIFLSGAVIFWSTNPALDLEDMLSELRVTVTRDDTGAVLFETTLTVAGQGMDHAQPSVDGPMRFEVVDLDDLADEGVDDQTLAVLENVQREGTLIVVAVPPQEHAYTYTVTADQALVLTAELQAVVRNVPDGSGVAATLGRPFQNLSDFIERGLPGVNGRSLERSVNQATASREIGLVGETDSAVPTPGTRLCGVLGFEGLALLAFGLFTKLGRSRATVS